MYDVVALGELLIDFTCHSVDQDGYPTMAAHPGGAPANFLAALARFGGKTGLIGKVGADAFGGMLIETLNSAGIHTRGLVSDRQVFTTLAFVTLDAHGDRSFSFARNPGADTCLRAEEVDFEMIAQARVFHFGTLSLTHEPARTATTATVEYAKTQGKLISFDPNLRKPLWDDLEQARSQMLWGLRQADVVKISDEEADFLFGLAPEEAAAHILEQYGVKLVFVTCGGKGCFFQNRKACGHVPALSGIQVADTTGAGDIFGGSAVWKLLQTQKAPQDLEAQELRDIVTFACASAGLSTTRPGGISSVPYPDEVTAVLSQLR